MRSAVDPRGGSRSDPVAGSAWPPEGAVLGHLLDAHPRRLDSAELAAELFPELEPATIERAVANLAEAGLIEESEDAISPAPKVIAFEGAPAEWVSACLPR